jgi:hypothetical protein
LRIHPAPWRSGYAAACKAVYTSSILVGASPPCLQSRQLATRTGPATRPPSGPILILRRVRVPLKPLAIVVAYAVAVGAVVGALLLVIGDDPWLPLLAAMAVVHLGFGLIVPRWWTVLLPLVVSVAAVVADIGGFSITMLLVGVPCALLLLAGVALRIGWDDGGRMPGPSSAGTWDGRAAYTEDHPEQEWDEADGAASWG